MAGNLDRVFVFASSFVIAFCLVGIAAMGSAAWSFSQAATVEVPLVATFRGYVEQGGSHAMTVQGSWFGVLAVVLALAAPLATVALVYRSRPEGI
ncbi:hypothetical protein D8Y23_06845 [Microbacterium enclense]|uniref:Uncharacterized protein n=2 Tax=Microbacterium enclense TaxID=993073 RepID=A0A443JHB0_9MICO|nr:hypothetical protein D8Y23_06845 [Microbacterium enclense]